MTLASGSGMVYEGLLPLQVEPVAAAPQPALLAAINDGNELLLANVLNQGKGAGAGGGVADSDTAEHDEVLQQLRRQDQKIRLVLDMMSLLLMQHKLLPAAAPLRFSGEQLSLPTPDASPAFSDGLCVKCSLYLDPTLPKPVVIYANAHGPIEADANGQHWQTLSFTSLNPAVQDQLEKFIFRQHRKLVAQQRRH